MMRTTKSFVFLYIITVGVSPQNIEEPASSNDCTSTVCADKREKIKLQDRMLHGLHNEVEEKYKELEEFILHNLKPAECVQFFRFLSCRPTLRNITSFCGASTTNIHNSSDCRNRFRLWAQGIRSKLSPQRIVRTYMMGLAHLRRLVMGRMTTNFNRARKFLQRHNIRILLEAAPEPVEYVNPVFLRRGYDSVRRQVVGFAKPRPVIPRSFSTIIRPWGVVSFRHLIQNSTQFRNFTTNARFERQASGAPAPTLKLDMSSTERRNASTTEISQDSDRTFTFKKIYSILTPVGLMFAISFIALWLSLSFRRIIMWQPSPNSYGMKYSAIPKTEAQQKTPTRQQLDPEFLYEQDCGTNPQGHIEKV